MIDLRLLRDEKTRELVKKSEKDRFKDENDVDEIYELDKLRLSKQHELEVVNKEINDNGRKITEAIKLKEKSESTKEIALRFLRTDLGGKKNALVGEISDLSNKVYGMLNTIGNIIGADVPICKTEDGNEVMRTYFDEGCITKPVHFSELMLPYTNSAVGSVVSGHRGYYLEGKVALLGNALKQYAIKFLTKQNYTYIQPPVMIKKEIMQETAQLSDFDDQLYSVGSGSYLIATSEQPLTALFKDLHLQDSDLPKYYLGDSLCFRKEAGAYGKDNAGIFRAHQFEKIEQFVLCKPDDSWAIHEKLIKTAEEFYKTLKLPYRIVNIASGELNDAASKKYDLEAWFPNSKKYRELVSCSNCTDYQSRNLKVYYGYCKENEKPEFVHMLNSTLCAVQRTLCCIVENYQNEGVIKVPEVLKEFLDFEEI